MTIEWWHIQNNDPMKSIWADAAKQYMAAHPNVKINITVLENEAFKSKLTTIDAGRARCRTSSSPGAAARSRSRPTRASCRTSREPSSAWIRDLNPAAAGLYQVDGKQYGDPVQSRHGRRLVSQVAVREGRDRRPAATWAEFLTDIQTLKASGITPLAVGEKDKWPGMFWWANLCLRIAGKDAMAQAGQDGSFDSPGFVKAGEELKKLIDLKPFQDGHLAAPWDGAGGEAAQIGNGKAAMDLMGQWAPSTFAANTKDGKEVLADLGWFPFPTVDGGAGAARASSSAAATASRSARTRRPRRSTSPSSSSPPTSPTRPARAAASCRSRRAPRRR